MLSWWMLWYYSFVNITNVAINHAINHPPVITIDIGCMFTIPKWVAYYCNHMIRNVHWQQFIILDWTNWTNEGHYLVSHCQKLPDIDADCISGRWFGCHFLFSHILGNNHPNWLSYFSEGFKPPTRYICISPKFWFFNYPLLSHWNSSHEPSPTSRRTPQEHSGHEEVCRWALSALSELLRCEPLGNCKGPTMPDCSDTRCVMPLILEAKRGWFRSRWNLVNEPLVTMGNYD